MMAERVPIDTYCEKKIPTLQKTYDGLIDYVDISSVDNTEKKIISYQTIESNDAPSRAKQLLKKGDVLVSTVRPNLNAVAVVEEETENLMVGSTGYCVLRCKDNMDVRYLFNFCQSQYFVDDMSSQATGASYPAVSNGIVRSALIPCYSIEEQREIAEKMDTVSELLALCKQQLAELDELIKSRFIELFGDPETNPKGLEKVLLSDIAEYFNGLTYSPDNVTNDGTIVLRSSNIQNSQLDFADTVRVNSSIKDKLFVKDNDILMCSRNGSARLVGKVALIKNLSEPMTFGAFMMIIRSRYYPYLMTYFQMDAFRRQIATGATTTINQITGNMLNKISLPLPNMADINEFATFVEQTDKSKLAVQQSIAELEELKKSLMQKYFG